MKEKRDNVEEKLGNVEEKQASVDERLKVAEERPEAVVEGSEVAEEKPENVNEEPESMEENLESTKETSYSVEEGPESTREAAAEKTNNRSQDENKQRSRKKITGFIELAVAFLLIALSAWLCVNTWGTRLLYVSVTTGRASRYYWVSFAIAAIFTVLGLTTLKSCHRENRKDLLENDKKARKDSK